MFEDLYLANLIIWIINIIFLVNLFPQILLNHRLKMATALSDSFILGSFLGQLSYTVYAFQANLPLVYKILNPLYLIPLLLLVYQRFYYSNLSERKKILKNYFGIFILTLIIILLITMNNFLCDFLGWLPIGIGFFKKLPQIFQTYFRKSVKGLSLGFIYLNISGYFIEMSAALFLNLPIQIIANDLKNIIIYSIFLGQFFLYKKINKKNSDIHIFLFHSTHSTK